MTMSRLPAAALVAALLGTGCFQGPPRGPASPSPTDEPAPVGDRPATAEAYPHLLLGNPSRATEDRKEKDNYLLKKPYFALSYNSSRGTPNWVSWRVSRGDLGDAPRKLQFDTDSDLPRGFRHVTHKEYNGSGFDRGHLCPHSDRAATRDMSYATFVMSNVVPQAPRLNQKAWAGLEAYLRGLARRGHRLYVIAGPAGTGGVGTAGKRDEIAGGKVAVPAACWKVAVVLPERDGGDDGPDDLGRITRRTRVIAVVMPNDEETVGLTWPQYRVPVKKVERLTGYTFFDRLPRDLAEALKAEADDVHVPRSRKAVRGD
jgi:endonuclease G, mitochondrial